MTEKWTRVIDGLPKEDTPVYVRFRWNSNDRFDYAYGWMHAGSWNLYHHMYGLLDIRDIRPYEWMWLRYVG